MPRDLRGALFPLGLAVLLAADAHGAGGTGAAAGPTRADLVLFGGHVLTMSDPEPVPPPTAVAIGGGRILYVGDDDAARALAAPGARLVDLQGGTVTPGFIDSHCHFQGLGKLLAELDVRGTTSPEEIVARAAAAAAKLPPGAWLQGRNWDQNDWAVKEYPDRALLDAVTGDRPALLRRVDGHAAWANSEALRLADITAATPDPAGGQIVRRPDGAPTGVLVDNAVDLVTRVVPAPDAAEIRRRYELAAAHCLERGVTGLHDAGVSLAHAQVLRSLAADGMLGVRVYGMWEDDPATLAAAWQAGPTATADGMLTLRAVKLYADGALGSRGALLLRDYSDRPGHRGLAVSTPDHLREVMRAAAAHGFQVGTHAIGDAGNRLVLDLYEDVLAEAHLTDARWRVEHAQILDPADLPRFAKLGVIAAMQPVHCTSDMDWAATRLGDDRLAGAYAWRSLLDTGAHLCFGTDFPVEKVEPLEGLYAARTRQHPDGTPIGGWRPEQALDARTALWLYTAGSAWAAFQEGELGQVKASFRADLVVLDGDPVACEPARLLTLKVTRTIVGGRQVWPVE
jgi:predicted amidohydrolase YtcJ